MSDAILQTSSEEPNSSRRRSYTDEFKRNVVRLITDEGYSIPAAAKACGACEQTVRNWHGRFVPTPEPAGDDASVEELRAEVKRLRKQLRRAELERAILEKATAYFAKESLFLLKTREVRLDQQTPERLSG